MDRNIKFFPQRVIWNQGADRGIRRTLSAQLVSHMLGAADTHRRKSINVFFGYCKWLTIRSIINVQGEQQWAQNRPLRSPFMNPEEIIQYIIRKYGLRSVSKIPKPGNCSTIKTIWVYYMNEISMTMPSFIMLFVYLLPFNCVRPTVPFSWVRYLRNALRTFHYILAQTSTWTPGWTD